MALGTGCKSKKKAMEAADKKAEREYLEQQAALEKKKKEEEQARLEAEARAKREADVARNVEPKQKLGGYFSSIAGSGNASAANASINEALTMFASPQTPVLIVISEYNGQKDYDRPTTIVDYLNYLKDQKKNMNTISNIEYDASGKITELELTKRNNQ
jgi:hypothetical protein